MDKTYTEEEIVAGVMGYSEGCVDGKISFLYDTFGISASGEQEIELRVRITAPAYDDRGNKIDPSDVAGEVERCIDSDLPGYFDAPNTECIDSRVSVA